MNYNDNRWRGVQLNALTMKPLCYFVPQCNAQHNETPYRIQQTYRYDRCRRRSATTAMPPASMSASAAKAR
jgi:hypothetical protein